MTPDAEPIVRPRTAGDLDEAVAVLSRVHDLDGYPTTPPSDPVAWLDGPRTRASFVAEMDGRIVGHVSRAVAEGDQAAVLWAERLGRPTGELAVVKRLFVDPSSRGRGVARRLLERIVADAHRNGLHPVLDVDASSASANALYERAGWQRVGSIELTWTGLGGVFLAHCYVGPPPPEPT